MTAALVRVVFFVLLAIPTLSSARVLRVVTDDNYPPFIFRKPNGQLEGYVVDFWKLWQKKTGIEVQLSATEWADAQRRLQRGDADAIDLMFKTPGREPYYDFSAPFISVPVAIYAEASISGIYNARNLEGFTIGVQNGDACVEKLHQSGISTLRLFPDYTQMIAAAARQEIKVFCMDEYPADYYLYHLGHQGQFLKAFGLYQGEFRRAVRKGDQATLDLVNAGMRAIDPREEEALRRKWLSRPVAFAEYASTLTKIVAALSIGLVALGIWLKLLRGAVRKRTEELDRERAQLHALIEHSPDLIWLKDLDGVYLACNRRTAAALGRPPEDILGKTDRDLYEPGRADMFRTHDSLALKSDRPFVTEDTVVFPNEVTPRLLETVKTGVAMPGGEVFGVLGVARDITERKLTEQRLLEQDALLNEMSAIAQLGGWEVGLADRQVRWTREAARIHARDPATSLSLPMLLAFYDDRHRQSLEDALARAEQRGASATLELPLQLPGAPAKWVRMMFHPVFREERVVAIRGTVQDITAWRALQESTRMANLIYQTSTSAIMVTDEENRIVDVNPAFTRQTGYERTEVLGRDPRFFSSGLQSQAFYEEMWRAILRDGQWQGEISNRSKTGELQVKFITIRVIRHDDGRIYRHVAQFMDITEQKTKDELIWKQDNFDMLTGLPNRRLFRDRLEQELKKAARNGAGVALLFIDLDHFRDVNDSLGHGKGDALLIQAGKRIARCLRGSDTLSRMGGDEFALVLTDADMRAQAERMAQQIIFQLTDPFELGDGDYAYVSASVGITLYPDDASDSEELLKNAEQAMYLAKKEGRSRVSYFSPALQRAARDKLALANDLRHALERGELEVWYQPIVDMPTGRIAKAEALLRWRHPTRGMVSPAVFIPIAEETGVITTIGAWVFHEAISSIERWLARYGRVIEVSVNTSPVQFEKDESDAWLDRLVTTNLPTDCVVLEITERMLISDSERVRARMKTYRDAGLRLSIDDFGTGFSSLSYLKHFDVDYLKIDQSFVRNLISDESDRALTEAIIVMAHKLGIRTIAEGVETALQRDILLGFGCDHIQGYLYARPLPREEFEQLLENRILGTVDL